MNKYSYINLIKQQAKLIAKADGSKLSSAQEIISIKFGFSNFHELTTIAKKKPNDPRLMFAAIGTKDLDDVIFQDSIYEELDSEIENQMSGAIAETNADGFMVEDIEVTNVTFDTSTGVLLLTLSFQYTGDQNPDKPWSGSIFYLKADMHLISRNSKWIAVEYDWIDITYCESDQDRDYKNQILENQYLRM